MCSPTAVFVTKVPMPARVLPNQSRAKAGLSRSGVRSTKCDDRAPGGGPGSRGCGGVPVCEISGGSALTDANYAFALRPRPAGPARSPRAGATRRAPTPTPPSPSRRATWVLTTPSSLVEHVMARAPVSMTRTLVGRGPPHPRGERLGEGGADGCVPGGLATARQAHDGVGGIQPRQAVEVTGGGEEAEAGLELARRGRAGGRRRGRGDRRHCRPLPSLSSSWAHRGSDHRQPAPPIRPIPPEDRC